MFIGDPERVVGDGDEEIAEGHEEKSEDLDGDSAETVDEKDGDPVARNGGTDGDDGLESGFVEGLTVDVDGFLVGRKELGVDFGLEEVAAVEDDVDEEPGGGTGKEIAAMAAKKLVGKEGEIWGRRGHRAVFRDINQRHIQHFFHILCRLFHIPLNQSRVSVVKSPPSYYNKIWAMNVHCLVI